ncbi:T9SS type A sorting domain-containing protein [candidate division KSB1 bacterium]|nr:T9SS type A sorting domain-containing protein [candidate division KSB1 bacterium]
MITKKDKRALFLILIFVSCLTSTLFSQSKGGRWQFENNGDDSADWDIIDDSGTLQNQAQYDTLSPLQEGTSFLRLDETIQNDYFKIEDSNDLDFDNENIGISAWIYPLLVGDDVHFILNKGDQFLNPKTTNYALRLSKSKKLEFLIRDANNQAQTVASVFDIPTNQWTFVAIFYDYSASKVYMWNAPTANSADTLDFNQAILTNDDPLAIGSWYTSNPTTPSIKDFEGRIDDVRISGRLEDILPLVSTVNGSLFESRSSVPAKIALYPNPISLSQGNITMCIDGPDYSNFSIRIFNVLGQEIFRRAFLKGNNPQLVKWNLLDDRSNSVNTGIYFVRLENMGHYSVNKFTVVR